MKYDAELKVMYVHKTPSGDRIEGRIFNDGKERFEDGTVVLTSDVQEYKDGYIITRNTVYKVRD